MKISEKKCTKCLKTLPADKFGLMKDTYTSKKTGITTSKYYLNSRCKACARQQSREWNRNNKEHMFNKTREWRESLKKIVYTHYGNICSCCGESDYMFLTIDHINNDGHKQRRKISTQLYKSIIDDGFPDDLQLLCYNCNCAKQRNFGTCPHIKVIKPYYGSRSN